ncbi:type II methionyl aminopeptidase [Candidatus Pacearchaeota archaeon]|nr:type II methionyl aminopeptidase [Candidatus Pacearchaeota archaeon]
MTEKNYAGATPFGVKDGTRMQQKSRLQKISSSSRLLPSLAVNAPHAANESEQLLKAGIIAQEAVAYARSFIKSGMPLLEIAEKIEAKIRELGGKPAFPVNLSMNEIAAHATPLYNEKGTASGLLKVDLGVHISGFIADTAFSLDLDDNQENKALIAAAEAALHAACMRVKQGPVKIREIGAAIETAIKEACFQPVQNLSGHSIERYEIHGGATIPNYDNAQEKQLLPGVYAIEPFATNGLGKVRDSKPSTIYSLVKTGTVRDTLARQVLVYIQEEYNTLPFCARWLVKHFGSRAIMALLRLEEAGLLHHYPQLIELGKGKVAQAEHTLFIKEGKVLITTASRQ